MAEIRARAGDTQKLPIEVGLNDPGHIDSMGRESCYTNRTLFVRTPILKQSERHTGVVKEAVVKAQLEDRQS